MQGFDPGNDITILLYAGDGLVYDSDTKRCQHARRKGVALRELSDGFYQDGYEIMYQQLSNAGQRSTQGATLSNGKQVYGTACQTRYEFNFFNMSSEDRMYCSKLVWRVFQRSPGYSVNLDSNHRDYQDWLAEKYSHVLAIYIITHTVAPDEVALSSHMTTYYDATVD